MRKGIYYFTSGLLFVFTLFLLLSFTEGIITDRNIKTDSTLAFIAFLFLSCLLGCFIFFIWNNESILESKRTIYIILCFIILIQAAVVLVLKTQPVKDLLYLHDQAVHLLSHKKISLTYHWDYFARYPNNNAYLLFLSYFYKVCVWAGVPVSKLIIAGNLLNMVFIDGAIYLGYLIIRSIESNRIGRFFIILCFLNPEIYLWVPFYYTHTCSLFITVLSVYLCLRVYKNRTIKSGTWYFSVVAMGVIALIGYKIRATNFITFIALIIASYVFSNKDCIINKKNLFSGGKVISLFCIGFLFSALAYGNLQSKHIDSDPNKELPVTHWIMMGSHGKGMFDMADLDYTNSFPTKESKKKGNIERTIANYKMLGAAGTLDLYGRKLRTTWAVGHDDYPNRLSVSTKYTEAHDWIIGRQSTFLVLYCYAFRFLMLMFICILSFHLFKTKTKEYYFLILILLGGMVFHCLWEANSKYSLCFMVINMILMTKGITVLGTDHKPAVLKRNWKSGFFIVSILCAMISSIFVIKGSKSFYTIASSQQESTGPVNVGEKYGDRIVQSFTTKKNFNMIQFATYDVSPSNRLGIKLLNDKKQVLDYQVLEKKELPAHENIVIEFKRTIKNNSINKYYLEFIKLDHQKDNIGISNYYSGNIDIFPTGKCYINGRELKKRDLRFKVFEAKSGTL